MEQPSMLDQLKDIDEQALAEVVRQDQRCPGFVITGWQVDRLSDKGIANPEGLFRFSGKGYDPTQRENKRDWTVVLKVLRAPAEEGDITNIWYWKREFLAFQAGLLRDLPSGGVRAPRIHGTTEKDAEAWIWMEYLQENDPPRWPLQRFPSAARLLGRLNGEYLCGRRLPDYPWLSRNQGIDWAKDSDPGNYWNHPAALQVMPPETQPRLQRLWEERERFFEAYHALPQVFAHCDSSRRNHLFHSNAEGVEEMVSIDWGWCGIAPIGWDLSMLLVDSALLYEMEPDELPGVEKAAFPMYLEGLRSWGWQGDERLVRLGYCVSATLFPLLPMPSVVPFWANDEMQLFTHQIFGCNFNELAPGWRTLNTYLLDLGEEALSLI